MPTAIANENSSDSRGRCKIKLITKIAELTTR